MLNRRYFILVLLLLFLMVGCGKESETQITEKIITLEKAALDRWGNGDPSGYLEIYADEITYFDPGTKLRVDGLKSMTDNLSPLKGQIKIERYDMINPKVQIHGETAILTFNLIDYILEENGQLRDLKWNSSEIYTKIEGEWKMVHSHWSLVKPKDE